MSTSPAEWLAAEEARVASDKAETAALLTPKFPEGTPEYAEYAAALRVELAKFVAGEAPYDTFVL